LSADKSVWPRFARRLSKDYRVLIPDLPGHGDTGYLESWTYSAPDFAESMKRFLDRLAIKQVHVVGNSLGGFVAAYFALNYPGSTLSATLIDATGVWGIEPSDMDKLVEQDNVPFFVSSRKEFDHFWKLTMA